MTTQQSKVIDLIAHDPVSGEVLLVMVEQRPWGSHGRLLPDLQRKLNTYLAYVTEGQLAVDYPALAYKAKHIQLRAVEAPGTRELEFLRLVAERHLTPEQIRLSWRVLAEQAYS